jgi:dihydroneopterin aldolase
MDITYITGIAATTVIGVYEHERHIRQSLVIDLEIGCDIKQAGQTDSLDFALDYDRIAHHALEFVERSNYFLIEAVAEHLAAELFRQFEIEKVKIKVSKPGAVSIAGDVGVVIERSKPAEN